MTEPDLSWDAFCALSARLGQDPLQIQGGGGNSSIKVGGTLWIKASGTAMAHATTSDIFVAVDLAAARMQACGAGDGTCRAALSAPHPSLRPSIETTLHAVLDWPVVIHTHSVAALTHAISAEGRIAAQQKLAGLPTAFVPYRKPGLPLTRAVLQQVPSETRVLILHNHGLVCCASTIEEVADLIREVEERLRMPSRTVSSEPTAPPPSGLEWCPAAAILATDPDCLATARRGSYYPDHVVFLGPAMPLHGTAPEHNAWLVEGEGVLRRAAATGAQRAMVQCLADVLGRLPGDWTAEPIGAEAEAELVDWDAERYRQSIAAGR